MSAIEYVELNDCVFAGVAFMQRIGGKNTVPREWERCKANGVTTLLLRLPERVFGDALLGWMGNYNAATKEFEYCIGVVIRGAATTSLPPSCLQRALPDCLLALGTIATGPQGAHVRTSSSMSEMATYSTWRKDSRSSITRAKGEAERSSMAAL